MKKYGLLFLSILAVNSIVSAQMRSWGAAPSRQKYSGYFAVRGGVSYFNSTPENGMNEIFGQYASVFKCTGTTAESCTEWQGYGPVYRLEKEYTLNNGASISPGDFILGNPEFANFSDWKMGEDLNAITGSFSVALGMYVKYIKNLRTELEITQYLDVNYKSYPFLKGYTDDGAGALTYDENLSTTFKSTITSSTFMLNILYDFAKSDIRKKGDFIPFIGAGIGLALNQTETMIYDQQGEFSNPDDASYFKYITCPTSNATEWSSQCYYTPYKNTETSLAWNVTVGSSYVLSPAAFIEAGIKLTNLGTSTWSIGKGSISETLVTTDNYMNTSVFIGYRRNF